MLKTQYELMAQYNTLMNHKIVDAVSLLSEHDLWEDRGAFFGSILGTLNHILVGDLIWLRRFNKHPNYGNGFKSLDQLIKFTIPISLDQPVYPTLAEYKLFRKSLDVIIVNFIKETTLADYEVSLIYKNTQGIVFTKPFGFLVQHLFNHQTHHRGQVTTLLHQIHIDIGSTDLLMLID